MNAVPRDGLTGGSKFSQAVQTNNGVVFFSQDEDHGLEPWVTDGTPAGTRLLKDIRPGAMSSEVDMVTAVNGIAMFMANDGVNGLEIWRTDGTPAGTRIVANIGPGAANGTGSVIVHERPFPVISNVMYFNADDGTAGDELWRTDGTAAGTYRLTDGVAGSGGIQPMDFQVVGTRLYFLATDAEGEELWTSDGTVSGSRRVANINPSTDRHIGFIRALGDVLFFEANEPATGSELWRADAAGNATRVTDLVTGSANSGPAAVGVANNRLIFAANTDNGFSLLSITATASSPTVLRQPLSSALEFQQVVEAPGGLMIEFRDSSSGNVLPLFLTDGTPSGTGFANSELRLALGEPAVARDSNWLYFFGRAALGAPANIYRTSGTAATTTLFATIDNPAPNLELEILNGHLFFLNGRFNDPVHGNEIWRTDGTPLGTQMLADLAPGTADTQAELRAIGNRLYLSMFDGIASFDPWVTDGTTSPTQLADLSVNDDTEGSSPTLLGTAGPYTLFSADDGVHGVELWSTNGTEAGTRMLTNFSGGNGIVGGRSFIQMNGFGLFVGNSTAGAELWRTDGTVAGTVMVKDIAAGIPSSDPRLFNGVVMSGVAYFLAADNVHGMELWRSDGTNAGTWMVFDAAPGAADGAGEMIQATANGRVFMRGTSTSPPPIYASDGTSAGSVMVSSGAHVTHLAFALQDRVCVNVNIVNSGTSEYFCSNGTAGNFTQLTDFQGMGLSPISNPYVLNGAVLLSGYLTVGATGGGIYAFDGTGAPPVKISDLRFSVATYIDGGSRLAFGAGIPGDITVTDGTMAGTRSMLVGTSAPRNQIEYGLLTGVDDSVLFRVNDPVNGPVLWKTDGTAAGTRFLFDVDPTGATLEGMEFLQNGNRVYFTAFRAGIGTEPWYFSTVAPNATDDYAEIAYGATVNLPVTANDSDFDSTLSGPGIEIVTAPAHGIATIGSDVISYSPTPGFSGLDRFVYRVLDAQGNPSNAANVSVTTLADASTTAPGTPPIAPPSNPPPSGGGGGGAGGGGGGGGGLGWEVLLLALLLLQQRRLAWGTTQVGSMFALRRNRFVGSYLRLSATRRE